MPTKLIDYLVYFYFVVDNNQYRGVAQRNAVDASLYDSLIEKRADDVLSELWHPIEASRLQHPTRWSAQERAEGLTSRGWNLQYIPERQKLINKKEEARVNLPAP